MRALSAIVGVTSALTLFAACKSSPSAGPEPERTSPPSTPARAQPHAVEREYGRRHGSDAAAHAAHAAKHANEAPGAFGLYVLSLSWAPRFCCDHAGKGECDALAGSFASDHLTVHGLWPNFTDAESSDHGVDYPQFCGKYSACKGHDAPSWCAPDASALPSSMAKLGPGYVTDHDFLATHEWPKHGSCTLLDAPAFFAASISAMQALPGDEGTPDLVRKNVGGEVAIADLASSFGSPESVLLSCDAECTLEQVGICLAHDAQTHPTGRVACPENVKRSSYDNGCVVHHCAKVRIPKAGECGDAPTHGSPPTSHGTHGGACSHPGQGPSCSKDGDCTSEGFLRCARSGCCTSVPR